MRGNEGERGRERERWESRNRGRGRGKVNTMPVIWKVLRKEIMETELKSLKIIMKLQIKATLSFMDHQFLLGKIQEI